MSDLLDDVPLPVTFKDMRLCAERELKKRHHVYPRLVAKGSMKQGEADEEIRRMGAIVDMLRGLEKGSS